jgi:hypothetical protein
MLAATSLSHHDINRKKWPAERSPLYYRGRIITILIVSQNNTFLEPTGWADEIGRRQALKNQVLSVVLLVTDVSSSRDASSSSDASDPSLGYHLWRTVDNHELPARPSLRFERKDLQHTIDFPIHVRRICATRTWGGKDRR